MNWNDLKIFSAIASAGTLAGAARLLRQNHSTIFRRLNALEADLETRLFERLKEGYVLTPAGERMQLLAAEAEDRILAIERELAGTDLQPTGTVRLTTANNIARAIVPAALKKLRKTHPGIVVDVAVGDSDYDLSRREADLALRATTRPPEHLVGRMIMPVEWWLCSAARQPQLSEAGAADALYIGADSALSHVEAYQWLEATHGDRIVARTNDLPTMAAFARAGIGIALLPSDQREPQLKRQRRIEHLYSELWLLSHPDLRRVARVDAVWTALQEAAAAA